MFDGRATRERPWLTWSVIFGSAALALACSSEDYNLLWAFSNKLRGVEFSASGPILFYPGIESWWMVAEPGGASPTG